MSKENLLNSFILLFSRFRKSNKLATFDKFRVVTGTVLILLFLYPLQGFADVEYSITNTQIDAFLQEDGSVIVQEKHKYEFDGSFKGITRDLIPKKGTKIANFKAYENGKSLEMEQEGHLHKIHRKGEEETILVTLMYTIQDGVEVFPDVAQFYWPFFDKSNESTYENLTVTIHPPKETSNVIAFGYDEAFDTETIKTDGKVVFNFGEVLSNKNGDIRVAYDPDLFPSTTMVSEIPMREEILKEQQDGMNQAIERTEARDRLSTIAQIGIPAFTFVLLMLMFRAWLKAANRRKAVKLDGLLSNNVPHQIMSIPATIYFTNHTQLPTEAMAAALLDLVRKGYVKKYPDDYFHLVDCQKALEHERILIELLFDEIGTNGDFTFDDLKSYTKETKNHQTYLDYQLKWKQAIKEEVKGSDLYEKKTTYRMWVGLSSIILFPFLFLFPYYGLLGWFLTNLGLFITVIVYAIVYHPKTREGARITYEWSTFMQNFTQLTADEWNNWSKDEQMRAFIYGLGMNEKSLRKKNDELVKVFQPPTTGGIAYNATDGYTGSDVYTLAYIAPFASSNFQSANQTVDSTTSSTSSGGGSGAGGGGGGSGAF